MAVNVVILSGRLVKENEERRTQDGKVVIRNTIAVNRSFGKEKKADFIEFVVLGATAEFLLKYAEKGSRLTIKGEWRTGSFEGKNGKVYTNEVFVNEVDLIDFKNNTAPTNEAKADFNIDDEDLPF